MQPSITPQLVCAESSFECDNERHDSVTRPCGIRLAMNQNQPLDGNRFHNQIEKNLGERREARLRGRPRLEENAAEALPGQKTLVL